MRDAEYALRVVAAAGVLTVVAVILFGGFAAMIVMITRSPNADPQDFTALPSWRPDKGATETRLTGRLGRIGWIDPRSQASGWTASSERIVTNTLFMLFAVLCTWGTMWGLALFFAVSALDPSFAPQWADHRLPLLLLATLMFAMGCMTFYLIALLVIDLYRLRSSTGPHVAVRNDVLQVLHPLLQSVASTRLNASKLYEEIPVSSIGAIRLIPRQRRQPGQLEIATKNGKSYKIYSVNFSKPEQLRLVQLLAGATHTPVAIYESRGL